MPRYQLAPALTLLNIAALGVGIAMLPTTHIGAPMHETGVGGASSSPTPARPAAPVSASRTPAPQPGAVGLRWTLSELRVHRSPAGPVSTTLGPGVAVRLTGEQSNGWVRTTVGWVSMSWLTTVAPTHTAPTTSTPVPQPRPTVVVPPAPRTPRATPRPVQTAPARPTPAPRASVPVQTTAPAAPASTTTPAPAPAPEAPRTADAAPASGTARQVWDCINSERLAHGVSPLGWDDQLATAANWWSWQMSGSRTLGHNTQLGTQVGHWRSLGENVGWTTNPDWATTLCHSWMASPGHRANILDASFTRTGIGVALVDGTLWATQDFRD